MAFSELSQNPPRVSDPLRRLRGALSNFKRAVATAGGYRDRCRSTARFGVVSYPQSLRPAFAYRPFLSHTPDVPPM
jgi:hypothetical protein